MGLPATLTLEDFKQTPLRLTYLVAAAFDQPQLLGITAQLPQPVKYVSRRDARELHAFFQPTPAGLTSQQATQKADRAMAATLGALPHLQATVQHLEATSLALQDLAPVLSRVNSAAAAAFQEATVAITPPSDEEEAQLARLHANRVGAQRAREHQVIVAELSDQAAQAVAALQVAIDHAVTSVGVAREFAQRRPYTVTAEALDCGHAAGS